MCVASYWIGGCRVLGRLGSRRGRLVCGKVLARTGLWVRGWWRVPFGDVSGEPLGGGVYVEALWALNQLMLGQEGLGDEVYMMDVCWGGEVR